LPFLIALHLNRFYRHVNEASVSNLSNENNVNFLAFWREFENQTLASKPTFCLEKGLSNTVFPMVFIFVVESK
jgi:hypothetical protein